MSGQPHGQVPQQVDAAAAWANRQKDLEVDASNDFAPSDLNALMTICKQYAMARCIPECWWDKPNDILVALRLGRSLGVDDIQMLQNSFVIDNRPTLSTQLMLGLAMRSPMWVDAAYKLEWIGTPYNDDYCSRFTCQRKGGQEVIAEFSVADAKKAGLWDRKSKSGKALPFAAYPKDLLGWRAASRGLRRAFPDMLGGLYTREEMEHEDQIRSAIENVDLQTTEQMRDAMTKKPEPVGEPTPGDVPPPPDSAPEHEPKEPPTDNKAKLTRKTIAEYFKQLGGSAQTTLLLKCGLDTIADIESRGPADLEPILGLVKTAAQRGKTNGK